MSRFLLTIFVLLFCVPSFAQSPKDQAVPILLSAGINPPAVLLSWETPDLSDIILRRRIKGAPGNSWEELLNVSETFLNGHFDLGLDGNNVYEYELERKMAGVSAYGYAFANFFTPIVDYQGKILVFIDSTSADQLGADLITYKNDLRGEGWEIIPIKTGNSTTVQWVKNQIVSAYNADPTKVKAVLLLGNVPVPYSGSTAWDGKSDHIGAWPCDAYYGDVDGSWTDNSINIPNTTRVANRNVPGDGKFDQNKLPSAVELMVGRVDFGHLSPGLFGKTPIELLRRYLLKNHLYRTGQYQVPRKAIVDDHLGWSNGEAFAADGYRNAYPITGVSGVVAGDLLSQSSSQRFLLGFGAGTNGSYSSADGIASAAQLAGSNTNVVFTSLFGDYFGDWDFETNPLMPSFLASNGGVLASIWSGRPHFFQQGLTTGASIGYCLKETQNAQYNDAYGQSNAESGTHLSLLGDPTLRAQIVSPITNLTANSNCNKVNLHWTAAQDSGILGYIVYRAVNQDGPYERLTPDFITQNFWDDLSPVPGTLFYAVRAMKLEVTPGGGAFYNASTSPIQSVVFVPGTGPTAIGLGGTITCSDPTLTLGTNFQPPTSTYQWYNPQGQAFSGFTATEPGVYTVVVTAPNGCTVAAYATVNEDNALPALDYPDMITLDCANPNYSLTIPMAVPTVQFTYNGQSVNAGTMITIESTAVLTVFDPGNGCSDSHTIEVEQDLAVPNLQIQNNGLQLDCNHASIELTAMATGNGLEYQWQGNGVMSNQALLLVTAAGTYCCTVTGSNACTASSCATVTSVGMGFNLEITMLSSPCITGNKMLQGMASGGAGPYTYLWSTGDVGPNATVLAGFTGQIGLTVTDNNNCSVGASFFIAPLLDILALATKESAQGQGDGNIDLLVSGGQAPYSFLWSNGSTTEDIASLTSGIYEVTVSDAQGCIKILTIPLITVGTQEATLAIGLSIVPNPARNNFVVNLDKPANGAVLLQLRDLQGKLVASQSANSDLFFFDTTALSAGIYVLWVETVHGRRSVKVVIVK